MSGCVLRFSGSAHREAERLLPWLVNKTLEGDELARVLHHLRQCAQCQREVEALRQLHNLYAQATAAPDATPSWLRLRSRLLPTHRGRPPWRGWRAVREAWTAMPTWLRGAVAAQAVVMLALAGLLLDSGRPPTMYRTLGDAGVSTPAVERADVHRLLVVFDPRIDLAQMQGLLRASQAHIVDGPNDAGAYTLAVPAARAQAVREALRTAPGVTLVESLGPDEKPDERR